MSSLRLAPSSGNPLANTVTGCEANDQSDYNFHWPVRELECAGSRKWGPNWELGPGFLGEAARLMRSPSKSQIFAMESKSARSFPAEAVRAVFRHCCASRRYSSGSKLTLFLRAIAMA